MLEAQFQQHAGQDGMLDRAGFLRALTQDVAHSHLPAQAYALLFTLADTARRERISLEDWLAFHAALAKPDAGTALAFRLLGSSATMHDSIPGGEILAGLNKHYGKPVPGLTSLETSSGLLSVLPKRNARFGYGEFSQLAETVKTERVVQAFNSFDTKRTGCITRKDFATRLKWHTTGTDPEKVSLPFVHAVVRLLHSQEELAEILARCGYQRRAAAPSIDSDLHTAFLKRVSAAPAISRFTPLELDVLAGMGAGGLRDLVGYVDAVKGDPDVVSSGSDGANVSPLRQSMQAG
ncbi:MAG: hypothetical protein SGCHY_003286, partial [Lobulomycetales sp.]